MIITVPASCISEPIAVPRGSLVSATPSPGATAKVEYTLLDNAPAVRAGAASWMPWRLGSVTQAASDLLGESAWIRITAIDGPVSLEVDERPGDSKLSAFRNDWGVPAMLATDASGSVTGLVGPDGKAMKRLSIEATNSVLLVGDSMCERSFSSGSASSGVDNGDGTATLTFSQSPFVQSIQTALGDTIRVNNSALPKLNQLSATVTAVDVTAKTVTYTTTGPYSPMVGGNPPFLVLERSLSPLAFFPYLNQLAGGELSVTSNCAQGGAALSEVNAIFDAVAQPARFGIFLCGRNDIFARSRTYAQTIADAKVLLDKMVRRCEILVVLTTPPQDSVALGGAWTTAKMQAQLQYETWIKQYARSIGAIIVDSGTAASNGVTYRDPASANANPSANFSPDGTHQAGVSAYAMGKAVYNAIKQYIVPSLVWPSGAASTYANDPSIISDNPILIGVAGTVTPASGTITGTAPDNTTVSVASGTPSVTVSQIARDVNADGDAAGNWLRSVITTTGPAQVSLRITLNVSRVTPSDVLRGLARFRLSSSGAPGSGNPAGVIGLNCQVRVVTANGAIIAADSTNGTAAATQALTEAMSGVLATPWMKLRDASQGAITSGYVIVSLYFGAAGGATLDLAHPHIRKLMA